jgi:hypothetical protein
MSSSYAVLSATLVLAVAVPVGLYALGTSEQRHRDRMRSIEVQPPPKEVAVRWSKAGIAFSSLFGLLFLVLAGAAGLFGGVSGGMAIWFLLCGCLGLVTFSWPFFLPIGGGGITLSSSGIKYGSQFIGWSEVADVRFSVSGKGSAVIVIRTSGKAVAGLLGVRRPVIVVPTLLVANADEVVAYAKKFLRLAQGGANAGPRTDDPAA